MTSNKGKIRKDAKKRWNVRIPWVLSQYLVKIPDISFSRLIFASLAHFCAGHSPQIRKLIEVKRQITPNIRFWISERQLHNLRLQKQKDGRSINTLIVSAIWYFVLNNKAFTPVKRQRTLYRRRKVLEIPAAESLPNNQQSRKTNTSNHSSLVS